MLKFQRHDFGIMKWGHLLVIKKRNPPPPNLYIWHHHHSLNSSASLSSVVSKANEQQLCVCSGDGDWKKLPAPSFLILPRCPSVTRQDPLSCLGQKAARMVLGKKRWLMLCTKLKVLRKDMRKCQTPRNFLSSWRPQSGAEKQLPAFFPQLSWTTSLWQVQVSVKHTIPFIKWDLAQRSLYDEDSGNKCLMVNFQGKKYDISECLEGSEFLFY